MSTVFGIQVLPAAFEPAMSMILPRAFQPWALLGFLTGPGSGAKQLSDSTEIKEGWAYGYVAIILTNILINNFIVSRFWGICPFLGVSNR